MAGSGESHHEFSVKQVLPWISAIAGGLAIATTWVALDLPRVVLSSELRTEMGRTLGLIAQNTERAESIEDFAIYTQTLFLRDKIADLQREIEDLGIRIEQEPNNRDLIHLRRTLQQNQISIEEQIRRLEAGVGSP